MPRHLCACKRKRRLLNCLTFLYTQFRLIEDLFAMCLIIHKPVNAVVSAEVIIDAYDYNRDGWGLMYAIAGKIEVIKGLNIIDLLEALDTLTKYEVFIHLRYRTHGTISYENLHPFQISKNIWLMHNGILSQLPTDKTKSDTALFAQMLMPMLVHNPDLLDDVGFCSLLSYYCKGSRLVFLRSNGQYTIINKQDGINWCGLWMSNTYAWTLMARRRLLT